MSWAIDHQQEVFDQFMPEAPRYGPDRPETAITVRSEGFGDRFDFLLKVTQTEENAAPTATVIVPEGAPLVVQVARARLAGAPTLEAAVKTIRLKSIALSPEEAKHIFYALMKIRVPLRPQTAILIHRDILEISVVGWSYLHLNIRDDRDRKPSLFGFLSHRTGRARKGRRDTTSPRIRYAAVLRGPEIGIRMAQRSQKRVKAHANSSVAASVGRCQGRLQSAGSANAFSPRTSGGKLTTIT